MSFLIRHWQRLLLSLASLLFALLHALGVWQIGALDRLDAMVYDTQLRAAMPGTLDERIVIVDVDEKSLSELGRWPWSRNKMANLTDTLFDQYHIALLGFDVVFAEADSSSGLKQLQALAQHALSQDAGFLSHLAQLTPVLDYDAMFAKSLADRPVVLGYYFSSEQPGRTNGVLPAPVMAVSDVFKRNVPQRDWRGYGANIAPLAQAAPLAGFFNSRTDPDGVVRTLPLVVRYDGQFYESLALAMFRRLIGMPQVMPGETLGLERGAQVAEVQSVVLKWPDKSFTIPLDSSGGLLVPFRGHGGPQGGSFTYFSASDVLSGRVAASQLSGKIVLLGTTAPGIVDLRATPVNATYPGIEVQANALASLLDRRFLVKPVHAKGYEALLIILVGLALAFSLPLLRAPVAVVLSLGVLAALAGLNGWLFQVHGVVLSLAPVWLMAATIFILNVGYGYLLASRSRRELIALFGTANRGTVDKYMGDCVMAFWGAPIVSPMHAQLAVKAAIEMADALSRINQAYKTGEFSHIHFDIGLGIGLNTGQMYVGDMGSNIRRSYTVIGDAVNIGSRLEGLCKVYGVSMVVSESTRILASNYVWQELDLVRVKGKQQVIAIFTPLAAVGQLEAKKAHELVIWDSFLTAYREQAHDEATELIAQLIQIDAAKLLYQMYAQRVDVQRQQPKIPDWDGVTNFETK
ncbi:MAG: adenylate/guanylate cyclase with chase sensor [Comamonadaceae bacterium]|nr:MAG: adenylate/guanylate cyclase with chase sensor [Comamonadaceae bacterium]